MEPFTQLGIVWTGHRERSCERLDGGDVPGKHLEGRSIGLNGLVGPAGHLQRHGQVQPRVRVSRHQLSRPLELLRGLEQIPPLEEQHAQVVVGGTVEDVGGKRLEDVRSSVSLDGGSTPW